jgi:hypothetical protein
VYHSRRTGLYSCGSPGIGGVVLELAGHEVVQTGIRLIHVARVANHVNKCDTIACQSGIDAVETLGGRVDDSCLKVALLFMCSNEEGVILNVLFQEVHNL